MIYLINPPSDFLIDDKSNMPLGLLFLHSYLVHNGIHVGIVDLAGKDESEWDIPSDGDIYGITATTPQFEAACKIAERVKTRGNLVILGGVHGTCATGESLALGRFDAVAVGEGEDTLLELVKTGKVDNIPGLYHTYYGQLTGSNRPFEKNIDRFRHPIIDAIDFRSYNCGVFTTEDGDMVSGAQIITARGCPHKCAFCCSPSIYKRKVRYHSSEYMEEWIDYLNGYGYNTFYIVDDTILLNSRRLKEICEIFKTRDSRWRACVRGDAVNKENIKLIHDAGCRQIDIGVESGSQKILDTVQKGEKVEDNANAIKLAHDMGIKVKSCLIVGLPGETQEDIDQTIDFINTYSPDSVTLCTFIPFPGCDIALDPDKYNYKIDYTKTYSKYVCCGADAMAGAVSTEEDAELTASFRKQLLEAIQTRSTNSVLKKRISKG